MRYASTFSGVEAATLAWAPLGWEAVALSEVDPFACAVLAHRLPGVPNLGDVTAIDWIELRKREEMNGGIDVVVGGSPCQSFSVAGRREGLAGESGLMWEYVRAVRELRPRWLVWENVPGALSSSKGEDFRCLLEALDELGYGLAWRVLDAQGFGVAQRRRRVFLVGSLGSRRAAEVLLEPSRVSWDPAQIRAAGEALARRRRERPARGAGAGGVTGPVAAIDGGCVGRAGRSNGLGVSADPVSYTLGAGDRHAVAFAQNSRDEVRLVGGDGSVAGALSASQGPRQRSYVVGFCAGSSPSAGSAGAAEEVSPTVRAAASGTNQVPAVAYALADDDARAAAGEGACGTLKVGGSAPILAARADAPSRHVVRRLTPRECERLMGMPDDWTRVPYRGRPAEACPDSPRYRAIGNSMAVPVMRWIGERIAAADGGRAR
ncbi:DNA cytosine methyltransferase [Eggerthellaceae bacterium zg-997]|nr:DNA cytosine methyltransferase [Eggerthellaceae bacterium zg-997]